MQPTAPSPKPTKTAPVQQLQPAPVTVQPILNVPPTSYQQHGIHPLHHQGLNVHQTKIAYFWDIENCPIPKARSAFDVVQQIRTLANEEAEETFNCIGDTTKIPKKSQEELALANVTLNHVPQIKPGDSDRVIVKEITRFSSSHQTPNHTIVLISGDVDFIQQLSSLRNTSKFKVVLLHNAQARPELVKTANVSFEWNQFLNNSSQQPQNASKINLKPKENNNNNNKSVKPPKSDNNNATPKPVKPKSDDNKNKPTNNKKPQKKKKEDKEFECLVCQKGFKSRQSLEQHQDQKSHFVCAWCFSSSEEPGPTFGSEESVMQHADAKHENECDTCGAPYSHEYGLDMHKKNVGHFLCHICMKAFPNEDALDQHQLAKDHAPDADSSDDDDSYNDSEEESSDDETYQMVWNGQGWIATRRH